MIASRLALLLALVALPVIGGEPPDAAPLAGTLRRLEKEIAAARGLEYKKPVVAKVIPRPGGADPQTQGYYSPTEKALYVYDDVKGNYARGVLIHEMVHALQDQHFGL